MDLNKNGKLLCDLRKAKGMTQKQVADKLGLVPKTVSKWETGRGFPDVSTVSLLAEILGVSEKTILSGEILQNLKEMGNMKRTKFYVCPHCSSFMQGTGSSQMMCCGKRIEPLKAVSADNEFNHEMTKEHYISFVSYVRFDRVLTVKLYPEQNAEVRFPKMYGGNIYFYCNVHGLFEYRINKN